MTCTLDSTSDGWCCCSTEEDISLWESGRKRCYSPLQKIVGCFYIRKSVVWYKSERGKFSVSPLFTGETRPLTLQSWMKGKNPALQDCQRKAGCQTFFASQTRGRSHRISTAPGPKPFPPPFCWAKCIRNEMNRKVSDLIGQSSIVLCFAL